ncbi:HPr family phosphocarrier protein [Haladaptatus sp. DYSN1]|uniref:HPr family phosphocarrier protein n=1 Tax=unclassified Haladaptatus TaxID=2622732 RepID=UPI0024062541|nr:HPr family phosphocarrier protein [Haladaptatus sp. DYSN1]
MERTVTVVPEDGIHARPAANFVETAGEYDAEITIAPVSDDAVNAGSMLAVTSLGITAGDDVVIAAEGSDAKAALDALEVILTTPAGD